MAGKFGIHLPNYPVANMDDLRAIAALEPRLLVVMQSSFGLIPSIRELMPGAYIVGRIEGGGGFDAWHPPYSDPDRMRAYGAYCRRVSEQAEIDICQYANEPGIDDNDSSWWTPEGYQRLAQGVEWFLGGWGRSNVALGTIPLSPGHQEDDGLLGAQYLKFAWSLHDVLLLHNYWNQELGSERSQWYGHRFERQIAAYGWEKSWAITEWNRDEPVPPGENEKFTLAADAISWFDSLPLDDPRFFGSAFFIWNSGDQNFSRLLMHDNQPLKDVAYNVNTKFTQVPVEIPPPTGEVPMAQLHPLYDVVWSQLDKLHEYATTLNDGALHRTVEVAKDIVRLRKGETAPLDPSKPRL